MRHTVSTLLISSLLLTGCAGVRDSRFNPFNWFGRAEPVAVHPSDTEEVNPLIPTRTGLFARDRKKAEKRRRSLLSPISSVTSLRVERVPGGAIVRATGVDGTQGAFNVALTPQNEEELPVDGVLTYVLERQKPSTARVVGSEVSREVTVARKITDSQLLGVRQIKVVAANNALTVRR